jgi:succinate-semialdehyde dehydrogenase / glutarate-semialdehyde dehydrogenase
MCSIAGERQPAPGGRRTRVDDPASGELITDVADGTVEDGLAAVGSTERAHPARAALGFIQSPPEVPSAEPGS